MFFLRSTETVYIPNIPSQAQLFTVTNLVNTSLKISTINCKYIISSQQRIFPLPVSRLLSIPIPFFSQVLDCSKPN
ncbi:hypothetical protein P5673_003999 [Acropora cervicornis]|uniref:Uncharacterized protein n=1 Tax=Acropora cervicornis TaxID=6130 RepID=A0AAD9R1I6_ACRCE|nr:hypothetical protein P5673_003999 [Acropora cervicornis]